MKNWRITLADGRSKVIYANARDGAWHQATEWARERDTTVLSVEQAHSGMAPANMEEWS